MQATTTRPATAEAAPATHAVTLRELERADMGTLHRWRSDPAVYETLVGSFRHVSREVDEAWFDRYLANRDHEVRLAIVLAESGALVGVAYLLRIDWVARSTELGLIIGESEHRGRGLGTQAAELAVAHAFDDLNLHRVSLTVLEDHAAAIRCYEKAGFEHEGLLRDAAYKGGSYRSLAAMGIVRRDASAGGDGL